MSKFSGGQVGYGDMADTIPAAIEENALGPKKASGDSGSVEQHNIADQIEAAKFSGAQSAASKNHLGLRFVQLQPPGAG